jgi:hypothetical protein
MKRFALAIIAVGALSAPALAADCAKDYKDFWQNLDREKFAKKSADQIADLSRGSARLRCLHGRRRAFTADNFFKKLDSEANAKASDIFNSGAFGPQGSPNAKK